MTIPESEIEAAAQSDWWRTPAPKYLYRYVPISSREQGDRAAQALRGDALYLSSPLTFNDPFDCLPRILVPQSRTALKLRLAADKRRVIGYGPPEVADASERRFLKLSQADLRKEAQANLRQTVGDIGIACFSEVRDDVLMWSHYASQHSGLCLRFNTEEWDKKEPLLLPVRYQDERPRLNFPSKPGVDRVNELTSILTHKASFWKAEREWRWLVNRSAGQLRPIAPKLIDGIIFGALATEETVDRFSTIARSKPHMAIAKARIDDDEFRLNIVDE